MADIEAWHAIDKITDHLLEISRTFHRQNDSHKGSHELQYYENMITRQNHKSSFLDTQRHGTTSYAVHQRKQTSPYSQDPRPKGLKKRSSRKKPSQGQTSSTEQQKKKRETESGDESDSS